MEQLFPELCLGGMLTILKGEVSRSFFMAGSEKLGRYRCQHFIFGFRAYQTNAVSATGLMRDDRVK
eukprot:677643-Rhodomonas_salina.2